MKDTKAWLKKIQEEESFAKKYKNLNNVESIQEQAQKDGYEINSGDLEKTSGGKVLVKVGSQKATINVSANGLNAHAENNANILFNMGFGDERE